LDIRQRLWKLQEYSLQKKLSELNNLLDDGQVFLRLKKSEPFLSGKSELLDLGGKSVGVFWFCQILFWLGLVSLIGILAMAAYIWMWDYSPLTGTVQADVIGIEKKSQGGDVNFQYEVSGKSHQIQQYANSTKRAWFEEDAKAEVVYLKFLPGAAKLNTNVEKMDWQIVFLGPIMPLGFLIGGYMGKKSAERLSRIEDNATHILNGSVSKRIPSKGFVIVQYKTASPISGQEIFGGVEVGKLEKALGGLQVGARVAVIYAGEKDHTLL
jgi:hypothetical protein